MKLNVFEPEIREEDIQAVVAALRRGEISGSFGKSIPEFESAFAGYCGVKHGIAVTSGSTALHLCAAALDLQPGDEVLVAASTNIATALGVHHAGATIVPVDSDDDTWNLNLDLLESLIGPRTRAVFPVHLFGHPVDMYRLMEIAKRHNLAVVEDAAEAHGAECRGKRVGSFGDLACFSFYGNKHITTGEGGMVTTNDDQLAEKVRLLRNLAFTIPRFRHDSAGFNFRMTGYQAAFGLSQLSRLDEVIAGKRRLARDYQEALGSIKGLQLPCEKDWAKNVYWMYAVRVRPEFGITRDQLAAILARQQIDTRTFFCPMNLQPCLTTSLGEKGRFCPVAEDLWQSGLYLPSSTNLTQEQIRHVAHAVREARRMPV